MFLDRDGVLTRTVVRPHTQYGSPRSLDELELLPGVTEAVALLKRLGMKVIVVTNQPEVSRGLLREEDLRAMHVTLRASTDIDDIYVCIHDDGDDCACRKPRPGMLLEAARKWDIDLGRSFMVGDRWRDVDAGLAAGCTTLFIGDPSEAPGAHEYTQGLETAATRISELTRPSVFATERAGPVRQDGHKERRSAIS